ncbi:MAG: hypothetical protein CVU14_12875, partial [Bacteroidetes bacterium HGW-Bacteroidetes-9]
NYEYSIDGTTWQLSGNFTNLTPGSYEVFIRDANTIDCFISLTTIEILAGGSLTATVDHTNVTCFGGNDGTITITSPTGGSGNYEYSIDGGVSWQTGSNFINLIAGPYSVMMRDADAPANIITLITANITEPEALTSTYNMQQTNCFGSADGQIEFTNPIGGSGNYEFSIDDGATWQVNRLFNGLTAGTYRLLIRDADYPDCFMFIQEVIVIEPLELTTLISVTPAFCGENNGTITVTATGGAGGFEYKLAAGTNWQTDNTFTGLAGGNYTLTIHDAKGCEISETDIIIQTLAGPEIVDINTTPVTNELSNGEAEIIANGTLPLEYSIDGINWQSANIFTSLPVGSDTAWVRDANGCSVYQEFIIMQTIDGLVEVSVDTLSYCLNVPIVMPI